MKRKRNGLSLAVIGHRILRENRTRWRTVRWSLAWLTLAGLSSPVAVLGHEGHAHASSAPDPASRTWTLSDSGAHLHGTFVSARSGKVQVRQGDGSVVALVIDELTTVDQQWISNKLNEIQRLNESPNLGGILVQAKKRIVKPAIADTFEPFAKTKAVRYRQDKDFFYVESSSMPDHPMMVGITAWQQQVPIPQPYFGDNAWRIPLHPVAAKNPLSAKSHFFRGAIALAANGIPIFNPIKNDGRTDTLVAGELDIFGGHCGRADDYHYHIAPTHLQEVVGKDKPIAYALDGYPIYGYTEPDGAAAEGLDEFNGHSTPELGYHYHATKTYPYLNGGFHGEVVEVDGQVDPQPRTGGVREALPPLRGAKITGFESKDGKRFSVKVQVGSETRYVNYTLEEAGAVKFEFVDGQGNVVSESYAPRQAGGGRGGRGGGDRPAPPDGKGPPRDGKGPPRDGKGPPRDGKGPPRDGGKGPGGSRAEARPGGNRSDQAIQASSPPMIISPPRTGKFKVSSPAFNDGDHLPDEFNGNGEGATPPLRWEGVPPGTKSFAIVMDHIDRDNFLKTYWNLYGIPAEVTSLPKKVTGVGKIGATWKRDQAYVPPHSAGGGKQTYTLHVYALSIVPQFDSRDGEVSREVLLTKIKDHILDSADLNVTYQRPAGEAGGERGGSSGQGGKGGPGGGRGGKGGVGGGRGGKGGPAGAGGPARPGGQGGDEGGVR